MTLVSNVQAQTSRNLWKVSFPICPRDTTSLHPFLPPGVPKNYTFRERDGSYTYSGEKWYYYDFGTKPTRFDIPNLGHAETPAIDDLGGGLRMSCNLPSKPGSLHNNLEFALGWDLPPRVILEIRGLSDPARTSEVVGRVIIDLPRADERPPTNGKFKLTLESRSAKGEWKLLAESSDQYWHRGVHPLSLLAEVPPSHELRLRLYANSRGEKPLPDRLPINPIRVTTFELEGARCIPDASRPGACVGDPE